MKKLLALAMLLVLCTVLTGLLTGCKVSAANTMMVDDTPKVAVTSPDVPVLIICMQHIAPQQAFLPLPQVLRPRQRLPHRPQQQDQRRTDSGDAGGDARQNR